MVVEAITVLLVAATCLQSATCQGIKGGPSSVLSLSSSSSSSGIKGGSVAGLSRFRESINQFKQQQQVVQPVVSQVIQQSDIRTSSVQQELRPSLVNTEVSKQVIVEQQTSGQADSEPAIYGSVQGVPGVDFPGYTSIPNTGFSCEGVPYDPGMYADESTGCQVYHLCYQGRRESFLCGIGTVFNQAIMNCDFWHGVDCSKSSQYYQLNVDFGKSSGEPAQLQQQVTQNVVVQRPVAAKTSSSFVSSSSSSGGIGPIGPIQATSSLFNGVESFQTVPKQFLSKTSSRREESSRTSSALSPANQVQRLAKSQFSSIKSTLPVLGTKGGSSSFEQVASASLNQQPRPQFMFGSSSQRIESTSLPSDTNIKGGPSTNEIPGPPEEGWKPYFKSKGNNTRWPSPSEVLSGLSSTTAPPQPVELTTVGGQSGDGSTSQPATVMQPDQEPSFSGGSSEIPKLPKSGTPPTSSPEAAGETTPETSIEPSVQPAATTTTPEPSASPSEAPKESSAVEYATTSTSNINPTTTTSAPVTTSAPNAEVETTPAEGAGERRAKKRASRRTSVRRAN